MKRILRVLLVAGLVWFGYTKYQDASHRSELQSMEPSPVKRAAVVEPMKAAAFQCDGRTHCSQMTSCAEATYFVNHCPGTQMDGDNDGEPCESQWCK